MSPIRSSAAAGSSHALGDNRFAKYVKYVSATTVEGRKTALSGVVNTTATLPATPTAGNLLVVMLSTNAALVQPFCAYGGTSGTQITGAIGTGIAAYLYYIPLTSSNVASGGTTLNITSASGPTVIGYVAVEMTGVDPTNPIDSANTSTGSWSSSNSPSCTIAHTTIGAADFCAVTLNGAQTSALFGWTGGVNDWVGQFQGFGNHTATNDICGQVGYLCLTYTRSLTRTELLGSITGRNGVFIDCTFRPAA